MFCSVIIPTIGRETLARAVQSVLDQKLLQDDFEIIVVNDSGVSLQKVEWQSDERVLIIDTDRRERSVARNTGAAIAKGKYLCFLDDDDWLLPGAFASLFHRAHSSQANWIYGSSQLVDRLGQPTIQLDHRMTGNCFIQTMAGEWIPLQSSIIDSKTFFEVGGFNPKLVRSEDVDLCRRMSLRWDLAETSELIACIGMGVEESSTDYDQSRVDSRWARERIIDEPGVFSRMKESAKGSYLNGRIVRIYLTSAIWNIQHKMLLKAGVRVVWAIAAIIATLFHVMSTEYWRAILRSYESETFLRGIQESRGSKM